MERKIFIASFLLMAVASLVEAGPMARNVEFVWPRVGQRGTTVEVRIQGLSLHDAREVVFFRPGIRAIDIEPTNPLARRSLMHGAWIDVELRCKFVIDDDCPLGEHAFRVRTATELTNIGTFHVSPFPVIDEDEQQTYGNDTLKTAKPVKLNVTVRGNQSSWARGDRDLFRVPVRAGERLSAEVDSARIANNHYGDSEFDLAVNILDKNGKVLARNDDNPLHIQDPLVSTKMEYSGDAFVEVRRSIFTPRDTTYCVHIGNFPRPMIAFPLGGQSGTRQKFTFLGDPLGQLTKTIEIPTRAGTFRFFGHAPSGLKLRSSPFPNLLEGTSGPTQVPTIPVALNGVIDRDGEVDTYIIEAKKGDTIRIAVVAASLGSRVDPAFRLRPIGDDGQVGEVELQKDDGSETNHNIFGTGFRGRGGLPELIDPVAVWQPKTTGKYALEIFDSSGTGSTMSVYRVELDRPATELHTYLASRTNDWTESMRVSGLAVPRGNRWTINLSLNKGLSRSIQSDFNLIAHGLPKGVRLVPTRIKPGTDLWPIQFVANHDAEPGSGLVTLEARPTNPNEKVITTCQQNIPFINHSGGDAWRTVRTDRYIAAVTNPAPFSIDIDAPQVALVQGGELSIPVKITRHGDFIGAVQFRCGFAPRSISIPPPTIIPPDKDHGVLELGARAGAPLETLPLVVLGSTIHENIPDYLGAGHVRVSSKIVALTIAQPFVELASKPESIRRGEKKSFVWSVRHHQPFDGQATVKLLGLPKGVTVVGPSPSFTKSTNQIAFALHATNDALLGQVSGLMCEVSIPTSAQNIVQRTGRGSLRIDPARSSQ